MFESQITQAGVARIGADPLDAIPLPYALPAVEPVA
jgi:hypothetical protein